MAEQLTMQLAGAARPMRAITLIQPWGTAIIHMGKDVENRGRGPWRSLEIGERIAIHAGLKEDVEDTWRLKSCLRSICESRGLSQTEWPRGALLGTAEVVALVFPRPPVDGVDQTTHLGCYEAARLAQSSPWRDMNATTLIVLRNPLALPEPIPCKGALGLWRVPEEYLPALRALEARAA